MIEKKTTTKTITTTTYNVISRKTKRILGEWSKRNHARAHQIAINKNQYKA